MVPTDLPGAGEAAASAVLTGLGIPAPVAAAMAWGANSIIARWLEGRRQIAVEELQRQMAKGRPWRVTDDRAAAMALQFARAYQEGVARDNLRLMAEFMFAEAAEPTLGEAQTRHNLALLASLSPDEMIACARMVRVLQDIPARQPWAPDGRHNYQDHGARGAAYKRHVTAFFVPGAGTRIRRDVPDTVEGQIIQASRNLEGLMAALLRTGWFVRLPSPGAVYTPTLAFEPVAKMVEFDAVAAV